MCMLHELYVSLSEVVRIKEREFTKYYLPTISVAVPLHIITALSSFPNQSVIDCNMKL